MCIGSAYYVLEAQFELWLVNAQHVKNVPGRKTDTSDAAWLYRLLEHGLLRKSFVPPRELRDLTRYHKALIRERVSEVSRLHKVLEDAGVKLATVASDVMGVSGRRMLEALITGTTDPEVLADLGQDSQPFYAAQTWSRRCEREACRGRAPKALSTDAALAGGPDPWWTLTAFRGGHSLPLSLRMNAGQ